MPLKTKCYNPDKSVLKFYMTDLDQHVILKWQVSERREGEEMRSKEDRKAKVWKFMLSKFIKNSVLGFIGGQWDRVSRKLSYNVMKSFGS